MSDAELALSSSGLQVLVGRCCSGSASMYVVGQGSVCRCLESSRAGGDPWAWAWQAGSAAGRDRDVTRGFPRMRRDFPPVREGQLVFLPSAYQDIGISICSRCSPGFLLILSAGRIRVLIAGRLARSKTLIKYCYE